MLSHKKIIYSILLIILLIISLILINDIDNADYSYIGDEFSFYELAKEISTAKKPDFSFLSQQGVYGYHPRFDSVYQGFIMKLFGRNLFGWKLSVILIVIISIFLVFLIGNIIFENHFIALAASIFYGFSPYLLAYAHIGYNNLNSLIPFLTAVFFYLIFLKRNSFLSIFFSGIFTGLSFYTFYSARLVLILISPFIFFKPNKFNKKSILIFSSGFLLTFLPFLVYNKLSVFSDMFKHPAVDEQSISNLNFQGIKHFLLGLFLNNPSFLHHYFTGPILSYIFAIFFVFGIFLLLIFEKKRIIVSFLFYWLLILSVIIIIVYTKPEVPLTRMHIILPSIALIAGYGLVKTLKSGILIVFILFTYILLQLFYFYRVIPKIYPLHRLSLTIKLAKDNKDKKLCVLCAKSADDFYHSCDEISYLSELYDLKNIKYILNDQISSSFNYCEVIAAIKQDDVKRINSIFPFIADKTGIRYYDTARENYIYYYK